MDEPTCPATPPLSKCPDTPPRAGCSKSSPSIWNNTSDTKENSRTPTPNRPSSPENCAICLGPLANKSFTNSCCHQFCFVCLLEWSKVKAECPLCKVAFDSIIHNVRSQDDYDQYHVVKEAPRATSIPSVVFWTHNRASMQYHFSEWMANRGLSRFRAVTDSFRHTFIPDAIPPGSSQEGTYTVHVRRTPLGTSAFRRSIYDRDLWARLQPDVTGRYRECSPEFYSQNPAQMHRLIPFINRELNVLLESGARTAYVLEKILELLPLHNMSSSMFRSQVARLIGHQHAPHFCHELRAFASSCYDMVGYDRAVQYHPNGGAGYSIEVDDIESENNANTDDDDIQIIEPSPEPTASSTRTSVLTSTASSGVAEMSVFDPGPSSSRGFSPVYRPSRSSVVHVSSSSDSDSGDPEDVQIVGYVKPRHERTPEVITLSSPEHPSLPSTETALHYLAPSQASISRPESPDDLICINLGNNSSAEHKWQGHLIDDSSDDALHSLNAHPCEHYQGLRKGRSRKINEDLRTVISSENSHSSFSSSDEEDGKRRRRKRKHSKHKKAKKDHGKKERKSSKSKHHKNNIISSDSEDMNQPSTSKGRPSRRRRSHNTSLSKSALLCTKDVSSPKSSDYPSKFKSTAQSPVDSDSDNFPSRSTIRSAIVQSNHSRNSSSVQDDSSPARLSGPKLRNIVMTRTTTGEGHDSWRVADSRVSPDKHRAHEYRSSSHHSSKSPSHHKHYSSPQHSKHQAIYDSDVPLKKRRSSQNEKDSRCLQDVKSKKRCRERSRYVEFSSSSPKKSPKPLAYSDDSG